MTDPTVLMEELINERKYILAWMEHPLTVELLAALDLAQKNLEVVTNDSQINDLKGLINHFEARGNRFGIRFVRNSVQQRLDDIDERIKNL